jgi:hypothetical protein
MTEVVGSQNRESTRIKNLSKLLVATTVLTEAVH